MQLLEKVFLVSRGFTALIANKRYNNGSRETT